MKQKSSEAIESALTATPTKQPAKAEGDKKVTPKKESKEEKKEQKSVINKKSSFGSFGKKNESILQHSLEELKDLDEIAPVETVTVDVEKDSRQIVEFLIKHVFIDSVKELRHNETQKAILLEFPEAQRVITYLEQAELYFYFCRLCECLVVEGKPSEEVRVAINEHFQSKAHLRFREDNGIKEAEDICFSILQVSSVPGDIAEEVRKEKEKALKRSAAKLKKQI